MANKPKVNTQVTPKEPVDELAAINAKAAAELANAEAPAADPVVPTEVEKIMDADVVAALEASRTAAMAKAAYDEAKKDVKVKNVQINMNSTQNSVGESAELIAATKADAEKRGKVFSVCPISGVLVVG